MSRATDDATTDEFVNYLPGMPSMSRTPGRIGRGLRALFGRRRIGALRVGRDCNDE